MRVVAIIQARLGSSRLPGKVLADLGGAPMLDRVIERARAAGTVSEAWVACPNDPADDPLERHCLAAGIPVGRGPGPDVLTRFRLTADRARAEVVVRLTGDCPLLDPAIIDQVVGALLESHPPADYAANVLERSFPRGLDVEAFTIGALERMDRLGSSPSAREHVTLGPRAEHRGAFTVRNVRGPRDDSDLRWTVDTAEDLSFVRLVYERLGLATRILPFEDVVGWCRANPDLARVEGAAATWDPIGGHAAIG